MVALVLGTVVLGLFAGSLGGLAGIGGAMIMIPGLHVLWGEGSSATHHVYMAASMVVTFVVAVPAAARHNRKGAVRKDLLGVLLTATVIGMVSGVLLSNLAQGGTLRVMLAVFLLAYSAVNVWRIVRGEAGSARGPGAGQRERAGTSKLALTGLLTGLVGGVLGLGGGVVMVPMLGVACGVRLRDAIGTSSAVMCVTAVFGSVLKVGSLGVVGGAWTEALWFALLLGPGAMAGSYLGAGLTHRLSLRWVRAVVTVLLIAASARLLIGGQGRADGEHDDGGADTQTLAALCGRGRVRADGAGCSRVVLR